MLPEDIPQCVDPAIEHLAEAWLRLLQREACITSVFHAGEGSDAILCLFGVTATVRDEFLNEMKTPPHFWFGPELTRRMIEGKSPLLTDKQLREATSHDGLNAVCWEGCFRPDYEGNRELQRYMMTIFLQIHQGYRWKEMMGSQSDSLQHLDFALKTGGCLWDPLAGCYTTTLKRDLNEIFSAPHTLGIARQSDWTGNWAGAVFDYHPPMLGFGRSANSVCSYHWRVEDFLPKLIPDLPRPEISANRRGREKRRHVLDYLRERPEDLRPFLTKASQGSRTAIKAVASVTQTKDRSGGCRKILGAGDGNRTRDQQLGRTKVVVYED